MPPQSRVERWLERPEPPPVDRRRSRERKQSLRVISGGGRDPEPRRRAAAEELRQQDDWAPRHARSKSEETPRPRGSLLILLIAILGVSLAYMATRPGAVAKILPAFAPPLAQQAPTEDTALQAPPKATKGQERLGAAPPAKPHMSAGPNANVPIPDAAGLVVLIRNTIVALDQANVTGNYSVLRAIAAPDLQAENTPARLSEIFAQLRASKIDLAPAMVVNPRLNQDPAIDEQGMLRLIGFIPFATGQVDFDLSFQLIDELWRLSGIGLKPTGRVEAKALPAGIPELPDPPTLVSLIRGSIIALNQANMTDDYSVLRELSAPGFQQRNSVEQLSKIFADMRASHIDFAPVAVIEPHLLRAPAIDERGMVRLAGFFPSKPERVNFDLAFQIVEGQWRMLGIGLNTSPEEPIASAAAPTQVEPAQPDASRQVADLERAAAATNTTPPIPRLRPAL